MDLMLLGAIAMASLVAGLFFLRFWRDTRDQIGRASCRERV